MNYNVNLHGENRVPIPEGLPQLISDIAREVLRCQPTALTHFISELLETKLKAREISKNVIGYVDGVLKDVGKKICDYQKYGITKEVAEDAAMKIQALYKGYKVRKQLRKTVHHSLDDSFTAATMQMHSSLSPTHIFSTSPKSSSQMDDMYSIKYLKTSVTSMAESVLYHVPSKLNMRENIRSFSASDRFDTASLKSVRNAPGRTPVLTDLTLINDQ